MIGLSDAEGDAEPAVASSEPFIEQHYVSTPVVTPLRSVSPALRTPSPSLRNEVLPTPVDAPTSPASQPPPPTTAPQAVRMIDAATECVL